MTNWTAIVMAAGHGTRMKSSLPKVLHEAAGRPLVYYPVRAALDAGATHVVVVVNPSTREGIEVALAKHLPGASISIALQVEPRGTGDATRAGISNVDTESVLVLSGDTPLLTRADLMPLVERLVDGERPALCFATFVVSDPTGYGRVLRDDAGKVTEIREHRDLENDEQRSVREVNAGLYAARTEALRTALAGLKPNNAQGEYYLTDVVAALAKSGPVHALVADESSLAGVNDRAQLHDVEQVLFARIRDGWAKSGVTVRGRPLIDENVSIGMDAVIEDGVRLRGRTTIGRGAVVDVGTVVDNSSVGDEALVKPYSVITDSTVGARAQIGPFAHLRPESTIEDEAHIGNFVETKKTIVRRGAKANHLAYLGDGDVGEKANLGAGTIFCNYDGFQKHRTIIGAGAFVGSDSQLIAPVHVGAGAYVATGTTLTEDVPQDGFAIGRARQVTKPEYASKLRGRLRAEAAAAKAATRESNAPKTGESNPPKKTDSAL